MRLLIRIVVNMFALWLADYFVDRISLVRDDLPTLLLLAVVFGLVNAFIRPIVRILTFPITLLTLGLFAFVVNALMLMLTAYFARGLMTIEGSLWESFVAALFGSLIISIVSAVANWILPDD